MKVLIFTSESNQRKLINSMYAFQKFKTLIWFKTNTKNYLFGSYHYEINNFGHASRPKPKGQIISFWCLQFPPKNQRKQVDLRFHSSKVEFVRSFFWRKRQLEKIISTFSDLYEQQLCYGNSSYAMTATAILRQQQLSYLSFLKLP